jgi:ATP-dependent RNA helicase HelY
MQYSGFTLDPFQAEAITHLEAGKSVLVTAPTGTGKTIIADWLVEQAINSGKSVIFTAPVKALSNQKFRDYCRLYGEEKVGLLTGDLVIRREAPCLVMTTEILRNMLLSGDGLGKLSAVILDEIHFLDDPERGTVWEEVLIYLPKEIQILGLSATLSNVQEFSRWLGEVRDQEVAVVIEEVRTVPLHLFVGDFTGGLWEIEQYDKEWKKWKQSGGGRRAARGSRNERGGGRDRGRGRDRGHDRGGSDRVPQTTHGDIFRMLKDGHMPYIYFVFSRRKAEELARIMGRNIGSSLLDDAQQAAITVRLNQAVDELGLDVIDEELYSLYSKGVAFHHAGVHVHLKALVEELYEKKLLNVLYTTSTFALGINVPARTVVLDGLHKYDGRSTRPLRVREFLQKAGRAGRRGMDKEGFVVVRMNKESWSEAREFMSQYQKAEPERVQSSFNLSFNSIVNLVGRFDEEKVREIVDRSFLAWHLNRKGDELRKKAEGMGRKLEASGWTEGEKAPPELKKRVKEMRRLQRRADTGHTRVWSDFMHRKQFLENVGYLAADSSFNAGAKILQHIQIEEIFTTELVLSGIIEGLPDDLLYGLCCAMTNRLPKGVRLNERLQGHARAIAKQVDKIRYSDIVQQAEKVTESEITWNPDLIQFGVAWANGTSLVGLDKLYTSDTDMAGQLVGGFRRAKDLVGQIRGVYKEDADTYERLTQLINRVKRDEVEVVD